jgi:hypothetical protein
VVLGKRGSAHRTKANLMERIGARVAATQRQFPKRTAREAIKHTLRMNPDYARAYAAA